MFLEIHPTYKQDLAWEAWKNPDVDDVIFGGAAGGGKTRWAAEVITSSALQWPETRWFLGRKELDTLMKTTFVTLTQIVFPAWKLETGKHWTFNGQRNILTFKNGSQINMLHVGELPSDPLFDRFGSHEYTGGAIDEMSEIKFRAYEVLRSRIGRYKNRELNLKGKFAGTLNPSQDWPYRFFYDPWKKAGRPLNPKQPLVSMKGILDGEEVTRTFVFIPALVGDNDHVTHEYKVNLATTTDPVLRKRLLEGDWEFSDAADILFDAASIADLFTSTALRTREKFLTVDVARYGGDRIVLTHWRGWQAYKIDLYEKQPINRTADLVRTALETEGIPRECCLIDQDGVGGGVVDLVPGALGFSGAAAPFGQVGEKATREQYENLRTQCVYHAAEKARARQIAVSEKNIEVRELLAADLQQFKRRDAGVDGKLKVAKKEDMKQALGRSPDIGDTIMMRAYFDLRLREEALKQGGTMSVYIPDDFE